jgi:RimJ/RimL family protein N-acetyltransferase
MHAAFDNLGVNSIVATVYRANKQSLRVAKSGMTLQSDIGP